MYKQVLIVIFVKNYTRQKIKVSLEDVPSMSTALCVEFIFSDYHGLVDKEQGRYMSAFPAFQFAESPDSGTCLLVKLLCVHSVCSRATFLDFLQVK